MDGFHRHVVPKELNASLTCSKCLKVAFIPSSCLNSTRCALFYCSNCAVQMMEQEMTCKCGSSFIGSPNKALQTIIENLVELFCSFDGCEFKGNHKQIYDHEANCLYRPVLCGCGIGVPKNMQEVRRESFHC